MTNSLLWLILAGILIGISSLLVRAEDPLPRPQVEARETHLQNLKQLTFGGQNAEAYFFTR